MFRIPKLVGCELILNLAVTVALLFRLLGALLREVHPLTIEQRIIAGPYYWAIVRKRRVRGEDEWQEHDMQIGVHPPDGHPYWAKIKCCQPPSPPAED